jgi:RNA 3'-terminal phosphate cyclase
MLLGGGKSNAGFDKLGETLKRAVSEGNNTENVAELATSLNLPAEKVQEAINKIKGQLKNTSNDNQ